MYNKKNVISLCNNIYGKTIRDLRLINVIVNFKTFIAWMNLRCKIANLKLKSTNLRLKTIRLACERKNLKCKFDYIIHTCNKKIFVKTKTPTAS